MTVQNIPHEQSLCTMTVYEPKPMCFGFLFPKIPLNFRISTRCYVTNLRFVTLFALKAQTYLCPCLHGQAGAVLRACYTPREPSAHSSQSSRCCACRLHRSLLTGLLPRCSRPRRRSALPPRHFARRSRESVIVGNTLPWEVKRPAGKRKHSGGEKP